MRLISTALLTFCLVSSVQAGDYETIIRAGSRAGISHAVLTRVVGRESRFNCTPGNHRYFGPLQISRASARRFGFRGGSLNNCGAGLLYGLKHLSMCVHRYGNSPGAVAACHARGG